jgi:hypothetical protein
MSEEDVKAWWEAVFCRSEVRGDLHRDLMALGARETGMKYCEECGLMYERTHWHPSNGCPVSLLERVHES